MAHCQSGGSSIKRRSLVPVLLLAVLASSGCAAVGLAFLSIGAGTAATSGVSYTLDSIAYKTFTASEEGLQTATLKTLERMDITVKEIERTQAGSKIVAEASDWTIEIELERLTTKTARMRVNAKRGWLLKDRATATEIISQTERTLDHEPMLTRRTTPPAAVRARTVASRAVPPRPQQGERESSAP